MKIFVNGRERDVVETELSYDQLVAMVFTVDPVVAVTVTWQDKHGLAGTLQKSQAVSLQPGMMFNVAVTNKA